MAYSPVPDIPINQTQPFTFTHAKTLLEKVDQVIKSFSYLQDNITANTDAVNNMVSNVNTALESALTICRQLTDDSADKNIATANRLDVIADQVTEAVTYLRAAITDAHTAIDAANQVLTEYHDDVARMEKEIADNWAQTQSFVTDKISHKVDKNRLRFDVADFGAVGDGVTDDTDAVLAAVAAAGSKGIIFFGPGDYRITRPVTLAPDCGLEGVGLADFSYGRDNYYGITCDFDPNDFDGYCFYFAYNCFAQRLSFRGKDKGIGIKNNGAISLTEVRLTNFEHAIWCKNTYYGYFYHVRGYLNNNFFYSEMTHNITFVSPQISCIRTDTTGGTFLEGTNSRCEVKVFGGSIEGYSNAFIVPLSAAVSCFGVYFEVNQTIMPPNGAITFYCRYNTGFALVIIGCFIYIGNHDSFVDAWSDQTKGTITSMGNYFMGSKTAIGRSLGFVWYGSNSRLNMTLMSDFWGVSGSSYYQQGSAVPGRSYIMNPLNAFQS